MMMRQLSQLSQGLKKPLDSYPDNTALPGSAGSLRDYEGM